MQTFLPYSDFRMCAHVLDRPRLGKQRIEAKQIAKTLSAKEPKGWRNHPAVKMWSPYRNHLLHYGLAICYEWRDRGYKDKQLFWFMKELDYRINPDHMRWPGDQQIHSTHRAALLYKNPEHYIQFGWSEKPELNYFWPV